MSDNTADAFILPGFVPRKEFAKAIKRCERTVVRLEQAGKVVTRPFGKHRLVDVEATAARMRGEDRKRRGRAA